MGLNSLASDLSGGNGINFRQKSFSVYPHGHRHKQDFPLIEPVTWDISDPQANPTFSGIAYDYSTTNVLDGLERGGISISSNRALLDFTRIDRFFQTPDGERFLERQIGLQLMNPKINAPQEKGLFGSNPANQKTYNNGINTLLQIGKGGMATGHIKREGTLPYNERGYIKGGFESSDVGKNRLLYLWNNKINASPIEKERSKAGEWFNNTAVGGWINTAVENVTNGFNAMLNALGGKGEELYAYSNGPGSTMGLGRTFIGRYTNTVEAGGKVIDYLEGESSYFDVGSDNHINFQEIQNKPYTWGYSDGFVREIDYGLGNPGKKPSDTTHKVRLADGTLNYAVYNAKAVDEINMIDVVRIKEPGNFPHIGGEYIKDMIPFYFESINTKKPTSSDVIYFRAFIDSIGDSFKASHNKFNYNGRAEDFYTYKGFDRDISVSFVIAAQTRHEMMPLYRKLNYLISHTAPEYDNDSGRIRTPFMRLTIGHWMNRIPGVLQSVNLKLDKNIPWEIVKDKDGLDKTMLWLPHALSVSIKFQPIHNFLPQKGIHTPFILPSHQDTFLHDMQKWLALGVSGEDAKEVKARSPEANKQDENAIREASRPGFVRLKEGLEYKEDLDEESLGDANVNYDTTLEVDTMTPKERRKFNREQRRKKRKEKREERRSRKSDPGAGDIGGEDTGLNINIMG